MNKEEIWQEVKKRYTIGVRIKSDYAMEIDSSKSEYTINSSDFTKNGENIQGLSEEGFFPYVYYKGKFAEIVSYPKDYIQPTENLLNNLIIW